jgi:hypothetical protein
LYQLSTSIHIDAPAEVVWANLTDFSAYPQWNPFVKRIEGELEVGARLQITLQPPGGKEMSFSPRIHRVEVGRGFAWLGRLLAPRIFDGEHAFDLVRCDRGVRFIHSERFRGALVPFMKSMLEGPTRGGFEAMNEALKLRCETSTESSPSTA